MESNKLTGLASLYQQIRQHDSQIALFALVPLKITYTQIPTKGPFKLKMSEVEVRKRTSFPEPSLSIPIVNREISISGRYRDQNSKGVSRTQDEKFSCSKFRALAFRALKFHINT